MKNTLPLLYNKIKKININSKGDNITIPKKEKIISKIRLIKVINSKGQFNLNIKQSGFDIISIQQP